MIDEFEAGNGIAVHDNVDSRYGKTAHTMTVVSNQSESPSPKKLKTYELPSDTG